MSNIFEIFVLDELQENVLTILHDCMGATLNHPTIIRNIHDYKKGWLYFVRGYAGGGFQLWRCWIPKLFSFYDSHWYYKWYVAWVGDADEKQEIVNGFKG